MKQRPFFYSFVALLKSSEMIYERVESRMAPVLRVFSIVDPESAVSEHGQKRLMG